MNVRILATGSKGNAYIIDDGYTRVLIDPGIPFKKLQEKTKHSLAQCSICLITHEHGDHIKSVKQVSKYIAIGMTVKTFETLRYTLDLHPGNIRILKAKKSETIKTLIITPFPVKHNAVDPVGYHFRSALTGEELVFVTDSQLLQYRFPKTKTFVIECNYDLEILEENVRTGAVRPDVAKRIKMNHHGVDTLLETLKKNPQIENLYLIHNSSTNLDLELALQKIEAQYKGNVFTSGKELDNESDT